MDKAEAMELLEELKRECKYKSVFDSSAVDIWKNHTKKAKAIDWLLDQIKEN